MQLLAKMNAKLNIGWKLTNVSCPACKGTSLAEPKDSIAEIYCPKCDKMFPIEDVKDEDVAELEQQNDKEDKEDEEYY